MTALVVGVDPGQTTGLFAVELYGTGPRGDLYSEPIAAQVAGPGVLPILGALLDRCGDARLIVAVETFVVGPRAARSSTAGAGALARALVAEILALARTRGADIAARPAAAVKPWATDKRLAAAGWADACKGMGHARDAARHALFTAVHAGLLRDPLSAKAVGE